MKRILYTCDNCEKQLAGTAVMDAKRHIRILRAEIRENRSSFKPIVNGDKNNDGLHFCNGKCVGAYFGRMLKHLKGND